MDNVQRTSEEYQWLADSVPVGIAQMRYSGKGLYIEYANRGLYEILRCSREEYMEHHHNYYDAVIFEEDWKAMQLELNRAMLEWCEMEMEYRVSDVDGRTGWRLMRAIPIAKENGIWFQCSIVDITKLKEAERKLHSLVANFPGCIVRVFYSNKKVSLEFVSEGTEELLGYTRQDIKDLFEKQAKDIVEDAENAVGKEFVNAAMSSGKELTREYQITDKEGKKRWIDVHSTLVSRSEDSVVLQYILQDISEKKQAEKQAQKEKKRLEIVAGLSMDSIFEYDIAKDVMQYYNKKELVVDEDLNVSYTENYTSRVLQHSHLAAQYHPDDMEKMVDLCNQLRSGKPHVYCEMRKQYEKGKYYWVAVEGESVTDENGIPTMVIGKISNVDERVKREKELKTKSEIDSLTGIYNNQTIRKKITKRMENNGFHNVYLVVADIDNFKKLNDSMGHLFGDAVLCTFADSMLELFQGGLVGRIGGDEFLIYIEDIAEEDLLTRLDKLNQRFERIRPVATGGNQIYISATFGVAEYDKAQDNTLDKLIQKADTALYYLKDHSKGSAIVYNSSMMGLYKGKSKREFMTNKQERVITSEGDLILFAHELFDEVVDIRSALLVISDSVTRFFRFHDILFIEERKKGYRVLFHWGGDDVKQFYEKDLDISTNPDWDKLLKLSEDKEYVVFSGEDLKGSYSKKAKSVLAFRLKSEHMSGICICIDRKQKQQWEEAGSALCHIGDLVIRRVGVHLEKKRMEKEAEYKMKYDRITDIPNYTYFLQYCEKFVKDHKERRFALVYTDFKNFQHLNEIYGYAEGDKILHDYAKFVTSEYGVFHARVTADRFVSLSYLTDMDMLKKKVAECNEAFCERINQRYEQCNIDYVAGLVEIDRNLESFAANVDNANVARKLAKQELQVPVLVYTQELREALQRQMEIVANMGNALESGEFKLYLQPKVNMFTNTVIGAEALVRWVRQDGSVVSPGDFIPIFEKNGFITKLDFEVLRQVLIMQKGILDAGGTLIPISVNFSRKHQENPNYIQKLDSMLEVYHVPTSGLEIEITESVFMYDLAPLASSIDQLKKRGIAISIDDFGAGYSSLNVLSRVKADIVKLDRQFILDVETGKGNFTEEFLQLLINMINQLGFKVLAEGVETEEQVHLLMRAGCRYAQGYFYAKPMPVPEFLAFLNENRITAE